MALSQFAALSLMSQIYYLLSISYMYITYFDHPRSPTALLSLQLTLFLPTNSPMFVSCVVLFGGPQCVWLGRLHKQMGGYLLEHGQLSRDNNTEDSDSFSPKQPLTVKNSSRMGGASWAPPSPMIECWSPHLLQVCVGNHSCCGFLSMMAEDLFC